MCLPFFRCESFPYISRRADWCHCASFPSHSSCTPLVFISVLCMSLSVPPLPAFPCTSLHFPFAPQYFPRFSSVFAIRTSKNTDIHRFSRFSAKGGRHLKPAKSRQGESSQDPCFATRPQRLRLVERHQIAARSVEEPPPPNHVPDVILYPL